MDLIQSYHDQESQSSSSSDELRFLDKNAAPSTSYSNDIATPKMVSNYEPLERIPIDRLMIATAAIATAQKPINLKQKQKQAGTSFAHWVPDFEKEVHSCLGSIQALQKHKILESMDRFISKLTIDFEKLIKPNIAASVAQYIRTYLHIYKYLFRSLEKGKRYYKRFIKILAIYTDFELSASIRGTEYDKTIAERIVLIYQSYLDHLDNSMVLDVLLNTKRLWRQHRGILVLLFEYFLVRKTQVELPDTLFMKNLIMFKKWLYIEEVPEEQRKARNAFIKCVKPKKTICMNSLFKPYLPVDDEGFVTVANLNDILDKEYALAPLVRCLKKAETQLEMRQNEEIIVLTDDENDGDDSMSNQEASSLTYSHHDEMSNDFDWYSASSQYGHQLSHSQNIIETVSIDSPPRNSKMTPSLSSLDSCDLNLDTTNSLAAEPNDERDQRSTEMQTNEEPPSSTENVTNEANGVNEQSLPTLNESVFNRLMNDINSTFVSIPGNTSTESKIIENGQTSRSAESSDGGKESEISEKVSIENEQLNGIASPLLEPIACSTNGNSSMTTLSSEHGVIETPSIVLHNHVDVKLCDDIETVKNCDNNVNIISSVLPLKNHEETLLNINEIVKDDLRNYKQPSSNEGNMSNYVQTSSEPSLNRTETACSPIALLQEIEVQSNRENEHDERLQEDSPQDWVPAAESTASVVNDTSLLSKSEQEVLFKDRDALIFADLFGNGSPTDASPGPEGDKSPCLSADSPITFLQNGIDPSLRMKTYARRNRRAFVETKTISTQTSRYSLSERPSPVTTIEENNSSKKDKYLLNKKDDDETFLRDIFNTADMPLRSGGSPRIRSPVYSLSTPAASTPIASTSTSSAVQNASETVQSIASMSEIGSAEMVVKRKRGRPRKYPLPDGATPVPKPPNSPRKPRQPKPPKEPSDEVIVFEKRVLRERKPKPVPVPVPVQPVAKKEKRPRTASPAKPKRPRRRNTIKMTIDAIFNTQSPKLRAVQARRISQILGIPFNSPALATILKRRSYNKPINISKSMNSDSNVNDSSMLQSFKNRTNGQMNSTSEPTDQQNTQSTILARKTYIKPNITISSFSSFTSALRRLSFSSRRISFSSSMRYNRTNNSRKSHSQRYSKIDIFDTSKKRGRKKGTKDSVPRKRSNKKPKTESTTNIAADTKSNAIATQKLSIIEVGDKVNETIELVDLTNEVTPFELDTSAEMKNQFENIHTALSSTQHIQNDSESLATKRRDYLSEDTETDFTNEFTTDPESTVEDTDDSHTRKSKRSRKRPKILDL